MKPRTRDDARRHRAVRIACGLVPHRSMKAFCFAPENLRSAHHRERILNMIIET